MPTEANIQAVRSYLPSGAGWTPQLMQQQMEGGEDDAVVFDDKQQAKLDEIVKKATARAGKEAREEAERVRKDSDDLTLKLTKAEEALAKATKKTKDVDGEDVETLKSQIAEMKSAGQQTLQQLEESKRSNIAKDREVILAKEETLNLKKTGVIKDAASKANFVDPKAIYKLTSDNVKFDDATGTFTVVGDDGQARLNTAYDPMTIEQFYAEFAAKNPWAVKGDMKPGAGSTTSTKYDGGIKQFKVEDIFGSKSNSKLANELNKADPAEYKKLRAIAVAQGLVA